MNLISSPLYDFDFVFEAYDIDPSTTQIAEIKSGHINSSFIVDTGLTSAPKLFLQQINTHVFPDVDSLMRNISQATEHFANNCINEGNYLKLIATSKGSNYLKDRNGHHWRMFEYLEGYTNFENILTPVNAALAGHTIAYFLSIFSTENTSNYQTIIPKFHNVQFRLDNLTQAISKDKLNRKQSATLELQICQKLSTKLVIIQEMLDQGKLPTRLCHNDTKSSNIMIDEARQIACLIDYDTIMPGSLLFDFGDCMRSLINNKPENEKHCDEVELNWALALPYLHAFVESSANFITEQERNLLPLSCVLLPYLMGVRFLTDYLEGDQYFKVEHPLENLHRANNQLLLADEIYKNLAKFEI